MSKLSQSGIPESSRSTIISSIIKHLIDGRDSEDKGSTNNNNVKGDAASTVDDANKNIQLALSNIGQLSPYSSTCSTNSTRYCYTGSTASNTIYGTDCTRDERTC